MTCVMGCGEHLSRYDKLLLPPLSGDTHVLLSPIYANVQVPTAKEHGLCQLRTDKDYSNMIFNKC